MPKGTTNPKIETRLSPADMDRFNAIAAALKRSRSDFAREALRWYVAHHEDIQGGTTDTELAQAMKYTADQTVKAINAGVDRICKMLARQGRAIATLYELTWMSLPDDENARKAFEEAATRAKQRMARHVESDERELSERMKKVLNS